MRKVESINEIAMASLLKVKWEEPSALSFIPTLVEVKGDGAYVFAYCPLCDKEEKSKLDHPGQPRDGAASIARIRAHIRSQHRKVVL